MIYIKNSFNKFKKDFLSKGFYDLFKSLLIIILSFIGLFISKYIPIFQGFLLNEINVSQWSLLLIIFFTSVISFFVSVYILGKNYKKILIENNTDEMTGLRNYKALEKDLNKIYADKNKEILPISLILIDIDNFKKINEEYSYITADNILKKLGDLLKNDSRITDTTYRYFLRGDEFLIIAKKTNIDNAVIASNRKRELINEATFIIEERELNLTVCCSVTDLRYDEDKEDMLNRLNSGLLKAKSSPNKNKTELYI